MWLTDWQRRRRRTGAGSGRLTAIGLGGAALGAALMFLFDPVAGQRRRALARETIQTWLRHTGDAVDDRSREVVNRARGLVIELRSRLGQRRRRDDVTPPGEARMS